MAVEYGNRYGGSAMVHAVSRRPLIADALVQSHGSPYGICGGHSDTVMMMIIIIILHPLEIN
jgi:hypothetical protein